MGKSSAKKFGACVENVEPARADRDFRVINPTRTCEAAKVVFGQVRLREVAFKVNLGQHGVVEQRR